MNYTHFVSVAGLVCNENEEILLIKSPWRGWEYPGGMVEPGETFQEALIREIKEEAGVDVEITGFIGLCKNIEKDIVNIDFSIFLSVPSRISSSVFFTNINTAAITKDMNFAITVAIAAPSEPSAGTPNLPYINA